MALICLFAALFFNRAILGAYAGKFFVLPFLYKTALFMDNQSGQ